MQEHYDFNNPMTENISYFLCDRIWEKGALRANPEFWF